MRHLSLTEAFKDGKKTWRLIGPQGEPLLAFELFSDMLLRKHPYNTRSSYCRSAAKFLDYLYEVQRHLDEHVAVHEPLSREQLIEAIESFVDWLVYGENAGSSLAKRIAKSYPSPMLKPDSVDLTIASVRKFLKLSERIRQQMQELDAAGLGAYTPDPVSLLPDMGRRRNLTPPEIGAMRSKSMLAGVISGGPRLIEDCVFPPTITAAYFDQQRAFPYDKVSELIASFTSYRDKALYSLIAASGCRIHEALQVLIEDIDVQEGRVRLIDPNSRRNDKSYQVLIPKERERLCWKGRATQLTLLIQPFADMFFEYLAEYLKREYIHHGLHTFVFQYTDRRHQGRPYFISAAASRMETFKAAKANVNSLTSLNLGPHSLRHMYGVYILNYFPRIDGSYGLPMEIVQKIMGHKSRSATERYARTDRDLIEAELKFANAMILSECEIPTLLELKRRALAQQLARIENDIANNK